MEHKIKTQINSNTYTKKDENLEAKVLGLIEKNKIKPTSKYYFSARNKAFWSLFVLSLIIGSIAFSVMIFTFTNSESEIYEITHDSIIEFILEMTPYIWIVLFATFAFLGYENYRHTNKGYKYSFSIVLLFGLVANIAGGVALHEFGISRLIDENITTNNMFIRSSDFTRRQAWNQPDKGVLSGEVISFSDGSSTFVLKDFTGNLWTISSDYIPDVSLDLISTSSQIRVVGITSGNGIASSSMTRVMSACYVLPWDSAKYAPAVADIREHLKNSDKNERNISDQRNNKCKAMKSYNIINSMVQLK
ncbi:MAG: hypothetical protein WCQ00_00050 [bacterium]